MADIDVERLARALHAIGHVLNQEGECRNVEGGEEPYFGGEECLGLDLHRQDARDIAAEYDRSLPGSGDGD